MTRGAALTRRVRTRDRLRVVLAAVVFAFATFAITASPISLPRPDFLKPQTADAAFCGSNAAFTGRLTTSSSSQTAIARTKSATVYGYISSVTAAWSCTAYYRYDGIAWNTSASVGTFNWGNLINSTSVSCNWVVGSTDYVKANSTTDCPDFDAEYAMASTLDAERVYQAHSTHTAIGDFSFVHSDCGTYYGAQPIDTGKDFVGTTVANRPGSNCDALTLDSTGTSQTITYDKTAPALSFVTPAAASGTNSTSYTVKFNATDAVAGFGGAAVWSLQRQIATNTGAGTCGTFANDTAAGNLVTGTTSASNQTNAQTLVIGKCYRWTLAATDQNGNVATTVTSATVISDTTPPVAAFVAPAPGTTTSQNTTSYTTSWTETETGSGIPTTGRALQREKVAISGGACGTSWTADGSAVTTITPVTVTLTSGSCYRWKQTLTDLAGNAGSQVTSGSVLVDTSVPMANFTTPDEGTTAAQTSTSYTVAWTETAGSGSITSRSLQRQKAAIVTSGSCADVTWSTDGSAVTTASPVSATSLVNGTCYRWVQTLTNSVPKTGASTSGAVIVDTTAPTGSITYPEANRPLAGDVVVSGTATDAGSFLNYQLEYGAGATPSSWTTIGSIATTQVTSTGPLGIWPTVGLNGVYTLRLTVRDSAGNTNSVTTRTVVLENSQRGDEDFFSRVPFDLGGGYALDVGIANGEARLSRDLFNIPSFGPPQELGLSYSSVESTGTGKFGVGWTSNLTQYLTFDLASNIVTWHRADGGRVPFGLIGSTWTPLAGHHEVFGTGTGVYTITLTDQTKLTFENSGGGRLTQIDNRFGKHLALVWNTSSATATDASGRATTLTIDSANNRITAATDSAGRAWGFGYTGTDLTSIIDPAAKVTTLGYDGSHHLTTVTRTRSRFSGSPETITWTVGYTSGKATSVVAPDGNPTASTFTYNAGSTDAAILKDVAGPVRNTTTYAFDSVGRVTSILDPQGLTSAATFDADSNRLTQTLPIDASTSFTTTWTYDGAGNVLTETRPIDATTSVTTVDSYNATNDLLTRSDADNDSAVKLITKNTYGSGHLTSVDVNCTTSGTTPPTPASGCTGAGTQDAATNLITNYAYTTNDQLAYEQDPLGRVTKHAYDSYGNETSVVADCTTTGTTLPVPFDSCTGAGIHDAQTNVTTSSAFDQLTTAGKAGLPTSQTDALGQTTILTYDALGRQLTEAGPGDATIPALTRTTVFDELGNTLTATDSWTPLGGGSASQQTVDVYDLANRTRSVTDPAGVITTTAFDAAGDAVSTLVMPSNVLTNRAYDGLGRVITETLDPNGLAELTSHVYDGQGNEIQTAPPDGVQTDRAFTDTAWVLTETVDPNGAMQQTVHTYDKLGHELTSTDPNSIQTVTTYDRPGRALTTTVAGKTTTTAYDRAGNPTSLTDSANILTTSVYDPLDRPTTVIVNDVASPTLPTEDVTTKTYYDAAGTTIAVTDPRGVSSRTIPNVRGLAGTTIADCTDSGTTPTTNPPACVGAGTQNDTTNVKTTSTYDGAGAAIQSISSVGTGDGGTTTTVYDADGRVQAVLDPAGTITRTFYTGDKVTKTVVNCTNTGTTVPTTGWETCAGTGTQDGTYNLTTTFTYDPSGNKASETAPNGRLSTYHYDDANRLIETIANDVASPTLPTEDVTTDDYYDASGRQAAVRAPTADGSTYAITRSIYDAAGRLVETITNCTNTGTTLDPLLEDPAECAGTGTQNAETNVITTYGYDTAGNRIRLVEPDPSATTGTSSATVATQSAYDADNRLCRVVQNATGSTDLQTLANPCSSATQTAGTTTTNVSTRYTYDGAGNLASMIDGNGNTTSYGYDAAGRLTSTTDADGKTLVYAYNDLGQRIRQENRSDPPMSPSVTWTYDGAGRIATRTYGSAPAVDQTAPATPTGLTATAISATQVNLAWSAATDNVGVTRSTIRRGGTVLTTVSGGTTAFSDFSVAGSTAYSYTVDAGDAAGNVSGQSSPASATTPTAASAVLVVADKTVLTTTDTAVRDRLANVLSMTVVSDEDAAPSMSGVALVVICESVVGSTLGTKYTSVAVPVIVLDNAPAYNMDLVLDTAGNMAGQTQVTVQDAIHPAAAGKTGAVTTFGAGDALRWTTTAYLGAAARSYLSVLSDATKSVAGTYDSGASLLNGHIAEGRRAYLYLFFETYGANQTTNAWDFFDALRRWAIDPTAPTVPTGLAATTVGSTRINLNWTAASDAVGVQGYKIYRNGSLLTTVGSTSWSDLGLSGGTGYTYTVAAVDAAGNASAQSGSVGATTMAASAATTYSYDANGNKLTASDGTLAITATYDRLNRPLTVDDEDAGTTPDTTYTYSLTSPSWTDPTGTYLVTLDKLDHPTSVDGPAIAAITTSYRSDGQVASETDPNGNTTAYLYDDLGRELTRTTTAGAATPAALTRTYNRAGHVLSENSQITGDPTNGTTTYAYDPLGRLASFLRASTTTYGWDEVPNRTSVQVGAGTPTTTSFDPANRPTSDSLGGAYTSDGDGRLTSQPGQRLISDTLGRLTTVYPATGMTPIATYTYDPLDRLRMVDYGSNNRVRFRYVGLTTSATQTIDDQSGSVLRNIGNGWNGERMLDWTGANSNIRYSGMNAHHDTIWTASSTGSVSATLRYDPFGTMTSSTGTSLPDFRFQGSWFDTATSLQWVVTRWYAPSLGRFVTEDSLLGVPGDPPSRHLYAYAAGEPVARWDLDGRRWYKVRAGQTYFSLAKIWAYGGSSGQVWLSLWQMNKNQTRSTTDLRAGMCIWIPGSGTNGCTPPAGIRGPVFYWATNSILYFMLTEMRVNALVARDWWGTWSETDHWHNVFLLIGFGAMVAPGQDWDHKPAIRQMLFRPNVGYLWTPIPGDPFKELVGYDIWSNIHYGYVGRSIGIPPQTLIDAQRSVGVTDQADDFSVELGIWLWAMYGNRLHIADLLEGVRDHLWVYRRIHALGLPGQSVIRPVTTLVPIFSTAR